MEKLGRFIAVVSVPLQFFLAFFLLGWLALSIKNGSEVELVNGKTFLTGVAVVAFLVTLSFINMYADHVHERSRSYRRRSNIDIALIPLQLLFAEIVGIFLFFLERLLDAAKVVRRIAKNM